MFKKNNLEEIANILIRRKTYLYHACQLQDFYTYLKLGGIASRNVMSKSNNFFTEFKSDKEDKLKNVWNHVFGNFSDFSAAYHNRKKSIPNPYGPILIKIDPNILKESENLFVSLRSVSAKNFCSKTEYLRSSTDFLNLFEDNDRSSNSNRLCFDKREMQLRFPKKTIKSPEWSIILENEIIPIDNFVSIIVDPITINGITLFSEIQRVAKNFHPILEEMVTRRRCNSNYSDLIDEIEKGVTNLSQIKNHKSLNDWVSAVSELDWLFERFAEYTTSGTLRKIGKLTPLKAS